MFTHIKENVHLDKLYNLEVGLLDVPTPINPEDSY